LRDIPIAAVYSLTRHTVQCPQVSAMKQWSREFATKTQVPGDVVRSTSEDRLNEYQFCGLDPEAEKISTTAAEREAARLSSTGDLFDGLTRSLHCLTPEITSVNLADISHIAFCSLTAHAYILLSIPKSLSPLPKHVSISSPSCQLIKS
jgi:hypothetical protein